MSLFVDFVGLNTLVSSSFETGTFDNVLTTNRNTSIATIPESELLVAINIHRNGPYNFSTFKQIRIHENPLTRYQRRNNLLSFAKRGNQTEISSSVGILQLQQKFGSLVTFTEPSVISTYHPLQYNLGHHKGDKKLFIERFGLGFDYGNHITYFTNEELNKLLLLDDLDDEVYEQIKKLYLNGALETNASEISYFEFLRYKQEIYPREINKYSAAVRQRTNYSNDFWRDARADRNRTKNLGFGYSRNTSMWNLDAETDWATRSNVEIGIFPTSTAEGILQNKFCHFTDAATSRNESLLPAPIYNRRHTVTTTSSVVAPSGIDIPETAAGVGAIFQGDALWEAGEQAGKNPFYSSYDYFVEELRGLGKDYSIVPEFRISDHVEILLKKGNLQKLSNMFEITGGTESSDVSNETGFYETYSTSDFLKHFASIKEDHKDFEDPATITLTCKALKKFLAYNSFYPQDRSVDCTKQFYSSYEKYMTYPSVVGNSIQPFLDTLFAPGVLYNTIKSGIAVDYPIIETGLSILSAVAQNASGSIDVSAWGPSDTPNAGTDSIILNDGGINGGVGAQIFPFVTGSSTTNSINVKTTRDASMTEAAAVINSNSIHITATYDAGTKILSLVNDGDGAGGNQSIAAGFILLSAATVTLGMAGGQNASINSNNGSYLINNGTFTKRIPFEAIVEPEKYLSNHSIISNVVHPSGAFNATASWDGKGDNLYTKMMSNYLAEIPEFFLQGSQLSTIVSEEQGSDNFGVAEFNKTYGMRLKIFKTMNKNNPITDLVEISETQYGGYITPQSIEGTETITMYSRPTAFGPPCAGYKTSSEYTDYYDSRNGINPPFTPPYYDGEAWIDFIWKAPAGGTVALSAGQQTGKFSLSEIMTTLTASSIRFDANTMFFTKGNFTKGPLANNSNVDRNSVNQRFLGLKSEEYYTNIIKGINANSVLLHASVNSLQSGRIISKDLENDTLLNENIQQIVDANKGATNARWVIQTKFETPILNFKDVSLTTASVNLHTAQTPRGMWHQYGVIPENNEGIYLQIEDIPTNWLKYKNNTTVVYAAKTGSLADLVGFNTNPVKLGQVAQGRVISEAVVAVPYINDGGVKKFFEINENNFNAAKKYFQSVDIVNKGGNPDNLGLGNPELWESKAGSSVIDQVRKMKRYVFPPTMDFFNYPEVTPFSMYIFEFRHTLTQQDLADMWQGLPPEIGTSFEVAEDSISHPLLANQLLGAGEGTDKSRIGADLEGEIRWMVFKVKKRANTNYFDKVVGKKAGYGNAALAAGFSTNASSETAAQAKISYNWPYDFFSLVELVKIDAEVEFADIPEGKFEPKQTEIPEAVQTFAANLSSRRK